MKNFVLTSLMSLFVFSVSAQQNIMVLGRVIDKNAEPVVGASVYLLNTARGVLTNSSGSFALNNLKVGKYVLQVSAVGFTTVSETIEVTGGGIGNLLFTLEEDNTRLDAVVVTAQKREEPLQNVPLSISALSAKDVKDYRLWNAKDITAIVPNLYSANSGDERNVTSVRGIGTTSYDPAIATYVDGVNQFTLDTYSSQLVDIERIEVLRGPQGTLYGRNAMGGVINIITKQPTDKPTAFAEANVGNYGLQRYEMGFRTPVVANKLYLGASAMYSSRDGYYTNTFLNERFDKRKVLAGNYFLKYKISGNWNVNLNLRHQSTQNDGAFPLASSVTEAFEKPYELQQNAKARMSDNTLFSSLSVNYSGNSFIFSSQTAYQANHRYYKTPIDGDFSPLDIVTIINDYGKKWNNVKTWTQEFKFTSPAASSGKLQWTAGSFLFLDDRPNRQATHYGADAGIFGLPDVNFATINTTVAKGQGIAFYGQATYSLTDRLDITGGVRYDYENKKYSGFSEYQKDGQLAMVTQPDTAARVNYSAFSPKAGLTWHASAATNVYGTYSRGFRTGGLTQLSSDPSQPPLHPFDPEYSDNFELGVKNSFLKNKLQLNLVFFYTNVTNIQVPTLVLPDAFTITRNAGRLNSKGAELELAATPVKGLQLSYNFGYTDASYTNLKLSQDGNAVDLKGKKQIYTPEYTSLFAAQYGFPLGTHQRIRLVVRGEWACLGRQYFDLNNTIEQKGYSLFNTRAGFSAKNFDVMFWGRNLGGKKYISYAYDFGAAHLGEPRTFGVSLGVRI